MEVTITIDVEFPDHLAIDPLASLEQIVAVLLSHRVPATFFVQGRWAKAYPHHVVEFVERGFAVGLHGLSHVDYRRLTPDGIAGEIGDGLAALTAAVPNCTVNFLRLPHGYGGDDETIEEIAGELGLTIVGWDYSTFDWDETLSHERCVDRTAQAVAGGGVVLFHSWPERTPDVLDEMLSLAGCRVVALSAVDLGGRQSNGRTVHLEHTDPPR